VSDVAESTEATRTISGKIVVITMFLFALAGIAFLQAYWNKHLEPFMPVQKELVEVFGRKCQPRVEGGQRKMSKNTPRILRVTMRVPFDPEDDANESQVRDRINGIADVASNHFDLKQDYDILTTHFFQENPGGRSRRQKMFETTIDELPKQ
jgi:hypothetical protein